MESYRYQQLHPGEMRLLKLASGTTSDHLRCQLLAVPLNSSPSYDALSYTWGTNEKTLSITIGDAEMSITPNLHEALRHLRHETVDRLIWADAICINQADDCERSSQVQKMAEIYSSAAEVAIWLGPEEEDVELAFRQIPRVHDAILEYGDKYVPNYHLMVGFKAPRVPDISAGSVVSFMALVNRPYFTRTWIMQEAMLAKKATVRSGSLSLPFTEMIRVFKHWQEKNFRLIIGISLSRPIFAMTEIKSALERGSSTLLFLLVMTRGSSSTDPRDRIFGLVGLISRHVDLGFDVDYNLSCEELYTKAARHQIVRHKRLEWLCMAGIGLYSGDVKVPSWVADWSVCDHIYMSLGLQASFRAAGDSVTCVRSSGLKGLEISAVLIDAVADIGIEMLPAGSQPAEDDGPGRGHDWLSNISRETDLKELFASLDRLTNSLKSYPTGEELEDAKLRTVVFDFLGTEESTDWLAEYQLIQTSCQRDPSLDFLPVIYSPSTDSSDSFDNEATYFDQRKERYLRIISDWTRCRTLCTTEGGYLGWVPDVARKGDSVFVFLGAMAPFVVRPLGGGTYKLVGECYIHGIMYGEALKGNPNEETISLV